MKRVIGGFICIFLIYSCKSNEGKSHNQKALRSQKAKIMLSSQEKKYLKNIKLSQKKITVGMTKLLIEKTKGDINHLLAKNFCRKFGIPLKVIEIKFKDIYKYREKIPGDLITNPKRVYDPDIFKRVDLVIGNYTILPWRKKIFKMLPLIPVRVLLVSKKGKEIRKLKELKGKKIGVLGTSSFVNLLQKTEKKLKHKLNIHYVSEPDDGLKGVQKGIFDITLADSNQFIRYQMRNPSANLNVLFPISKIQYLGWLLKKDNHVLAGILRKYFQYLKKSKQLEKIFLKAYKFSLDKYYEMVNFSLGEEL